MTWLDETAGGESGWDWLTARFPDAADALEGVVGAAWAGTDPALLELARLRMAAMLGNVWELQLRTPAAVEAGVDDEKINELAAWPTSPVFTELERACLSLVEHFVMDANEVTDEQVAAVTEHLGSAGCYAFVEAVSVLETFQRACLTLGIEADPDIHRPSAPNQSTPESTTKPHSDGEVAQ